MAEVKTFCYLITWSEVDTVKVGTYIIDTEERGDGWGASRTWTLYYEASGEFRDGWSGRKLDRLCTTCRREHHAAALHGHDGSCGVAPMYRPPAEVPA